MTRNSRPPFSFLEKYSQSIAYASLHSNSSRTQQRHQDDPIMSSSSAPLLPITSQPKFSSSRRIFLSIATLTAVSIGPSPTLINSPAQDSKRPKVFLSHNSRLKLNFSTANAAVETIGKDPNCNDATCLGVWDGILADCPHNIEQSILFRGTNGAGCVSSQDDTPGIFSEPWDYSESIPLGSDSTSQDVSDNFYQSEMDRLLLTLPIVLKQHGDDMKVDVQSGRYLRTFFKDGSSGETSVGEFYFTPNDTTVQFRIATTQPEFFRTTGKGMSTLSNMERSERIRKALGYLKVPVLRNRKRAFLFVESDGWDGFGPGSAFLGIPEEMSPADLGIKSGNQMNGLENSYTRRGRARRLSEEVDPRLKIDWVESFPFKR